MPIIYVACTDEDFKIIETLAREIWTEHYTSIIGQAQVDYMLEKFQTAEVTKQAVKTDGYVYYIAKEGDQPIGYCGVKPECDTIFLSKIYVHKQHRGKGIARRFVDRFLKDCGEGKQSVYLTVNKGNQNSIARYRKMGFIVESDIVTDIGGGFLMDDYLMRMTLNH